MRKEQWIALKTVLKHTKDYAEQQRKKECSSRAELNQHWSNSHQSLADMVEFHKGEYIYHSILNNVDIDEIILAVEAYNPPVDRTVLETQDPELGSLNDKERIYKRERLLDKIKLLQNHWVWRKL